MAVTSDSSQNLSQANKRQQSLIHPSKTSLQRNVDLTKSVDPVKEKLIKILEPLPMKAQSMMKKTCFIGSGFFLKNRNIFSRRQVFTSSQTWLP